VKTIVTMVLFLCGWLSAMGAPTILLGNGLDAGVANADLIAIISVTNAIETIYTNADHSLGTNCVADALVERTVKGTAPKTIRVKDVRLKGLNWSFATERFLVFLKPSDDLYVLSAPESLTGIYGTNSEARIAGHWWPCITIDQAVGQIEKLMRK
jgi:hypothetical protein